jgi:protein-disulfide isomerase
MWVILIGDFQCPGCAGSYTQNEPMLHKDYVKTGKIRMAFLNYPLRKHPHALAAAAAAMCAGAQDKFWPFHDSLYATQRMWSPLPSTVFSRALDTLAAQLSLDLPVWRDCIRSKKMLPLIQGDEESLAKRGVDVTPSYIVDDKIILGPTRPERLRQLIDSALAKRGSKT